MAFASPLRALPLTIHITCVPPALRPANATPSFTINRGPLRHRRFLPDLPIKTASGRNFLTGNHMNKADPKSCSENVSIPTTIAS
jgi:hypothetical protein